MGKSLLFANFAYICNLNKHQDEKDSFLTSSLKKYVFYN